MMKVTFLGTSGSTPTRYRSLPAIAIEYEKDILLFDCGEGAQRQMMINDTNISKIKAIFNRSSTACCRSHSSSHR